MLIFLAKIQFFHTPDGQTTYYCIIVLCRALPGKTTFVVGIVMPI